MRNFFKFFLNNPSVIVKKSLHLLSIRITRVRFNTKNRGTSEKAHDLFFEMGPLVYPQAVDENIDNFPQNII